MRIWPLSVLRGHAERKTQLDARTESAAAEKELSEERLERMRKDVVDPVQKFGRQNHFAELIRQSLMEGHDS